jgi:SHS2 domain-containing protein
MNRFRLLEHTADMGIAAKAGSLDDLLRQAALGLRQILIDSQEIRAEESIVIEIRGEDLEELLISWLGELLYLLESRQFLPATFDIQITPELQLRARLWGERLDPSRHQLQREIKAVTYHQIKVEQAGDGWRAQVYVDL